ncbi:hypothetical protein BDS110ZK23_24580 [Bradyrhizobium diazoefficiens]|uniref:Anti-bacteriophage protein A/HamA C-terminal domain-containing protein n=1 Tax=Bradyrhizobium diazoefficiens TaxID=1355477 RepID=A0A810BWB8_9BRAD|nr:hypothetical protein XF9B_09020 [Bradyrhizobium diazoefficiens]BCE96881.1 hypothetical protein XF11B_09020 [Bradyrhizobium diazoefficiens]BCF05532.1 hypothetical protein XF12B_09050 [Bradyrhizobium diazoefficiens]BCF57952.1 hypothetical protein XF18B_09000 [Bradyrhizobium diazoefficiens]
MEWLPDYALPEDEMQINHGNAFIKLRQAAIRVYTSEKYEKRGECGEIALHAVCRQFFDTIPISPRVFYKSSTNDVVKSFDLVHARFPSGKPFEIWLGESKLYEDSSDAIGDAISSIVSHIDAGFLKNQKLLLGPQVPKTSPHYDEILKVFKTQTSIDEFLKAAVFVIGISCNSIAAKEAEQCDPAYVDQAKKELAYLVGRLSKSGLCSKLRIVLVYIPLASKAALVSDFDKRLKGLQ